MRCAQRTSGAGAETRGCRRSVFNKRSRGRKLINTARAEVVDAAALERRARTPGSRRLDVFTAEPPSTTGDFADRSVAAERLRHASHRRVDRQARSHRGEAVRIVAAYGHGKVPTP